MSLGRDLVLLFWGLHWGSLAVVILHKERLLKALAVIRVVKVYQSPDNSEGKVVVCWHKEVRLVAHEREQASGDLGGGLQSGPALVWG